MTYQLTSENKLEQQVIQQLISGVSQWTYRADLKTEEDLWANFFDHLSYNNTAKLDGVPLTDQEKRSIRQQLSFPTFYKAAEWLSGENGIAQVKLDREEARLGSMMLKVIGRAESGGGSSVYEVVNQIQSDKRTFQDQDARFDLLLLINGLPMIQIELKNKREGYMSAFHQINRYIHGGKYQGIFSTIQMFVVSNQADTKYIAATDSGKLNARFLTGWVDQENQPVRDLLDFTREVLNIPQAHKMVTQYSVLDHDNEAIILLRPYQVHAIRAVDQAAARQESGFVWHTTGSGKTLTSYKVARNLLQVPSVEKTIFVIDRRDLDQQTSNAFTSYAAADYVSVEETSNVSELIKRLASAGPALVVTTIQKLNHVMKKYQQDPDNKRLNRIRQLKIAFVVDECHRAVTPQKQRELSRFFRNPLWFGFTGTPLFEENKRDEFGDLARTTVEQYGQCLHKYTVKEAIHDSAVLGFQIEYKKTIDDYQVDELYEQVTHKDPNQATDMGKERELSPEIFEQEVHLEQVVDSIINKSLLKLGLNQPKGMAYDAILTTSSIKKAIRYYDLFQAVRKGEHPRVSVGLKTQKALLDFPKVGITFSVTDNEAESVANKDDMVRILKDYNEQFGTAFNLETLNAYNRDLNNRLARKQSRYLSRNEQLDIVIVVDRLLTGFDAPCLSTLFMDRSPMKPHHLIQAFSRTNRLFDQNKKFGQIVTFQTPHWYKESVDKALQLYANSARGTEDRVQAPSYEESLVKANDAIQDLRHITPTPQRMDELTELQEMKKAAKAFQQMDTLLKVVQVYSEFDQEVFEQQYGLSTKEFEDYTGAYKNLIERIRALKPEQDSLEDDDELDIEYQIETVRTEKVDYDYIILLIDRVRTIENQAEQDKVRKDVEETIQQFGKRDQKLARVLQQFLEDVLKDPEHFRGKSTAEGVSERLAELQWRPIKRFAEEWAVNEELLTYVAQHFNPQKEEDQVGLRELVTSADYERYKSTHDEPLNKIKYNQHIRKLSKDMIQEEVLPYNID